MGLSCAVWSHEGSIFFKKKGHKTDVFSPRPAESYPYGSIIMAVTSCHASNTLHFGILGKICASDQKSWQNAGTDVIFKPQRILRRLSVTNLPLCLLGEKDLCQAVSFNFIRCCQEKLVKGYLSMERVNGLPSNILPFHPIHPTIKPNTGYIMALGGISKA